MRISKKIGLISAGVIAGGLASASYAAEKPPLILEPSTSWRLDFGDERCSLIRSFGEGDDAVSLEIDSYGSSDGFPRVQMLLTGKPIPASNKPASDIHFAFSTDNIPRTSSALLGQANDLPAISFSTSFMPDPRSLAEMLNVGRDPQAPFDFERFKDKVSEIGSAFAGRTDAVTLYFDHGAPLELKLGNMAKPLATMDQCIDSLIKSWGIDPAEFRTEKRPSIPLPTTVHKIERRYPSEMILNGLSAFVPVRVMVDKQGGVTDCVIQTPNVNEVFKETACNGLARRFEPALDKDGQPMASFYQVAVIYLTRK